MIKKYKFPIFKFTKNGFHAIKDYCNNILLLEDKVFFYNYQIDQYKKQYPSTSFEMDINYDRLLRMERDYYLFLIKHNINPIYIQEHCFNFNINKINKYYKQCKTISLKNAYLRYVYKEFNLLVEFYPLNPFVYKYYRHEHFGSILLEKMKLK